MNFEVFLMTPGLSHLAMDIFLMLDADSLYQLEQVCTSWKRHFVESNLWKKKLLTWAQPGTIAHHIVSEALKTITDEEQMTRMYRTLCLNRPWYDKSAFKCTAGSKSRKIDSYAKILHERLQEKGRTKPWEDIRDAMGSCKEKELVSVNCVDICGDRVSWGEDSGDVCFSDGITGRVLCGSTRSPVDWVRFDPAEENIVASSHRDRTIKIWVVQTPPHKKAKLKLLYELGNKKRLKSLFGSDVFSAVDLSGEHLIAGDGKKLIIYAKDKKRGKPSRDKELKSFKKAFASNVGDAKILSAILLRSEPGLAVTGDYKPEGLGLFGESRPSLKVWDVTSGQLLHSLWTDQDYLCDYQPTSLSECTRTGLLAVGLGEEVDNLFGFEMYFCGAALLPAAGLRSGLALGSFADGGRAVRDMLDSEAKPTSPEASVVLTCPTRMHVVFDGNRNWKVRTGCLNLTFEAGTEDKEAGDALSEKWVSKKAINFK